MTEITERVWQIANSDEPGQVIVGIGPAGSGPSWWAGFLQGAPSPLELRVPVLPGRWTRSREPLLLDAADAIADLAASIAPGLRGETRPVTLVGVCGGAVLALGIAEALGSSCPARLELFHLPTLKAELGHEVLHLLDPETFRRRLVEQGAVSPEVADDPLLYSFFEPILHADMTMVERHQPDLAHDRTHLSVTAHIHDGEEDALDQWTVAGVKFTAVRYCGPAADNGIGESPNIAHLLWQEIGPGTTLKGTQ